jgi:hypothetical protein
LGSNVPDASSDGPAYSSSDVDLLVERELGDERLSERVRFGPRSRSVRGLVGLSGPDMLSEKERKGEGEERQHVGGAVGNEWCWNPYKCLHFSRPSPTKDEKKIVSLRCTQ